MFKRSFLVLRLGRLGKAYPCMGGCEGWATIVPPAAAYSGMPP